MKNILTALLIPIVFLIVSAFSFENGGAEIVIVYGKTSSNEISATIPEKFIGKDGQLLLPFELEIATIGKMPFTMSSQELKVTLPSLNYSGKAIFTLKIGSYKYSQEVVL